MYRQQSFEKPWWRRRRLLWPAAAALAFVATAVVAYIRSGWSRVIFMNETGATLPRVEIKAGALAREFHEVADRDSVVLILKSGGEPCEIAVLGQAGDKPLFRGGMIEPGAGERVFVRLERNGDATTAVYYSWRRRWFGDLSP